VRFLKTRATPQRFCNAGASQRGAITSVPYLYLSPLPFNKSSSANALTTVSQSVVAVELAPGKATKKSFYDKTVKKVFRSRYDNLAIITANLEHTDSQLTIPVTWHHSLNSKLHSVLSPTQYKRTVYWHHVWKGLNKL